MSFLTFYYFSSVISNIIIISNSIIGCIKFIGDDMSMVVQEEVEIEREGLNEEDNV